MQSSKDHSYEILPPQAIATYDDKQYEHYQQPSLLEDGAYQWKMLSSLQQEKVLQYLKHHIKTKTKTKKQNDV